jgi:hypothetical protein
MSSTPQFGTAEYKSATGPDRCKSCQQQLSGVYFRINGLLACERCTRQLQGQTPKDTHAAYVRGILFGVGGAIAGLILYSAFGVASLAGSLLFAGFASPFLELTQGVSGLIGLVIIFVGIRIAWKMTGAPRLDILGPFQANASPAPASTV